MADWLTILIILLIVGILLDGWRRVRGARRGSLKVSRRVRHASDPAPRDTGKDYGAELPNGGARVVGYRETPEDERPFRRPPADEVADEASEPEPEPESESEESEPEPGSSGRGRIPEQVSLNLDESVPILMETEEDDTRRDEGERIEPTLDEAAESEPEPEPEAATRAAPGAVADRPAKAESPGSSTPPREPEEVLVIHVMAPSGERFRGDALLDAILQTGMRYGDMEIFHRYEKPRGGGAILYSLANGVKPGTFDLDAMEEFTSPGVSLFMTLPLEAQTEQPNVEVFEAMLSAAREIGDALGGELKDENRSVLTRQTQEHCRQRILEFERKQLSRGL